MNKEKQKELDETSVMGGVGGGTIEFGASKQRKNKKFKMPEEYYINRKQFIEELRLRKIIQEAIIDIRKQKKLISEQNRKEQISDELRFRSIIKKLIKEVKKDTEDTPHSSTAINILEDMLKQILPNLETDFKTLTTKKEQRDSFRAHIVNAVSTLLETEDINKVGGKQGLVNLDEEDDIEEEVKIRVSDVEVPADEKFIDIEGEEELPEEEEDTFGLEGQDETGKALSQEAFNNMEKNITETYAILHDDEDEKLFKDYLITNLKLYFDKWEQELGAVTEPTTDEYEAEKTKDEAGIEAGAELGGEFGGEAPTRAGGEELIQ